MGVEIGSKVCHIIGSDGGVMPDAMNHRMPPNGLLTDVAYRWWGHSCSVKPLCGLPAVSRDARSCKQDRALNQHVTAGRLCAAGTSSATSAPTSSR